MKIVGITGVYEKEEDRLRIGNSYLRAMYQVGIQPVLLPMTLCEKEIRALAEVLAGVVFTGGGDITPQYYGQRLICADRTEPIRDAFECLLYREMALRGKPMLGICRGMQLLAVANGVPLIQNVQGHENISHQVAIIKSEHLFDICKTRTIAVNSFHRQAVAEPDSHSDIVVCGRAKDGTIEAIWHRKLPFCLGIQWHPERMCYTSAGSLDVLSAFAWAVGEKGT